MHDPTHNLRENHISHSKADLRSFLAQTDNAGKTLRISKPVDPATEVAALCSETTRPLLLENIKGYPGSA